MHSDVLLDALSYQQDNMLAASRESLSMKHACGLLLC